LVQRCTVHKHRNLLAHAPERLHEEISADYKDMIYAGTKQEIETKRKAFVRKWRLKCPAVAASLEEASDRLFTFTRFPKSQWKSIRTSNAIERLHEEFKRRIKTQTVLPSAETAAMFRVTCRTREALDALHPALAFPGGSMRPMWRSKAAGLHLYRAVDKQGKTVDFLLRAKRDVAAAKAFYGGRSRASADCPHKITLDGYQASHRAACFWRPPALVEPCHRPRVSWR
jgi:transposase-like protein